MSLLTALSPTDDSEGFKTWKGLYCVDSLSHLCPHTYTLYPHTTPVVVVSVGVRLCVQSLFIFVCVVLRTKPSQAHLPAQSVDTENIEEKSV